MIMQNKGLGVLMAAAAAYGYYRYSKMTPDQRNALKEKGKKWINDNVGPLGKMFETGTKENPTGAPTNASM